MYRAILTIPNKKTTFKIEVDIEASNISQAIRIAELKNPELEIISIIKK